MEQVFTLVNQLLAADPQTARRSLQIRTYKIIPLAPDLGLMEFVINTKSLSEVMTQLLGEFRPKDWNYQVCRHKLSTAKGSNPADFGPRIQAFEEVLEHNKPVFRFFFYKAHKQPSKWFEQRLQYSRSVAVVSIVGYALGIGDRHTSNLLLDLNEGEIVPIDFGITFDAGTRLPIPELIPFRLTQNFIDGFGMTGLEGVYKRCCEEILRVLRARTSIIMTILEVFKYDPLQKWCVRRFRVCLV
jgi:ataxia telangiectasia mutated family protein